MSYYVISTQIRTGLSKTLREVLENEKTIFRAPQEGEISELNKISFAAKSYWNYPKEWMDKWKNDLLIQPMDFEKLEITVAEVNDHLVGFCGIEDMPEQYEIHHLWLLPAYIGKGLGKKLLERSLDSFKHKPKKLVAVADPNAQPFYEKQGFVQVGKVESYPKGRFLPIMERK